jgi:hypothetical protein
MKQPQCTRVLENLLNPIMGKSVVIYLRKEWPFTGSEVHGSNVRGSPETNSLNSDDKE